MFVLPAISALLTFLFLRPHEVFEIMRPLTLAGVLAAVALGYVLDLRLGLLRPRGSVALVALGALTVFAILTIAIKVPETLSTQLALLATCLLAGAAVGTGLGSFRAIGVVGGVLLGLTLALAAVGDQQGATAPVCYLRKAVGGALATETSDGRPCASVEQCEDGGVPDAEYLCEHPGLMGTHSIGGRVRYRGILEDPNELCMALSAGVPIAFLFYQRKRSKARLALLVLTLALVFPCVILTKSRSGQISMLAVLGVYFVRRFGRSGILAAVLLSVPLLLLGGRSGAEADSSSEERLECWAEALEMWRENPLLGVGQGQFKEHHFLTAHNSFLLALAELGPGGLFLWTASLYAAFKTTIRIQLDFAARPEAAVARDWAVALTASLVGITVSSMFLSLTYHVVVWVFIGLAAALSGVVRRHEPTWRVRFGLRDLVVICGADVALVAAISVYLRLKGV
jgi:hypothetical protein